VRRIFVQSRATHLDQALKAQVVHEDLEPKPWDFDKAGDPGKSRAAAFFHRADRSHPFSIESGAGGSSSSVLKRCLNF
jgi:hypothetical protein